jgi:hypothetical protein
MMLDGRQPGHFIWMTIMISNRGIALSTFAAISFSVVLAGVSLTPAPAHAAGAQFCIARGGGEAGAAAYVGNCVYSDYQACLNAAAASRGNCVQNVEYRGDTAPTSTPSRSRRAR